MRAVIQRVRYARVHVGEQVVGEVGRGMLVLLAVLHGDGEREADRLAEKVAGLRFFSDAEGRMNRSVLDEKLGALVVSQFTLAADTRRGRRPSFAAAAEPVVAEALYLAFAERLRALGVPTQCGSFGAHMQVELVNDGPVTLLLEEAPGPPAGTP